MSGSRLAAIARVGALGASVAVIVAASLSVGVGSAATTCRIVQRTRHGTHLVWRRRRRIEHGHRRLVWVRVRARYTTVAPERVCTAPAPAATTTTTATGVAPATCRVLRRVERGTHLLWRRRWRTIDGHRLAAWVRVRVRYRRVVSRRLCSTSTTSSSTTTTAAAAPATSTTTTTAAPAAPVAPASTATPYSHVVVLIEENYSGAAVVGGGQAPYLSALAAQGEYFPNYHGVTHPSEPNYLALFSGSTQGTDGSDACISSSAPSIVGEAAAAGVSVHGYVESLTSGTDYACRHDPFSQFSDARAYESDFSSFPTDYATLPRLSFVIPNTADDMHDSGIASGDAWAAAHIDGYAQWAKTNDSLLIVISDENEADPNYGANQPGENGNNALAIVVGAGIAPGSTSQGDFDHYSLLRTLEDIFGLGHLGASANAVDMFAPTDQATP